MTAIVCLLAIAVFSLTLIDYAIRKHNEAFYIERTLKQAEIVYRQQGSSNVSLGGYTLGWADQQ